MKNNQIYKSLSKIVAKNKSLPIIENCVLITSDGRIIGTNLETFVSVTYPSTWAGSGSGTIPMDVLKQALSGVAVSFDFDNTRESCAVNIDGRKITVPSRAETDFPELPEYTKLTAGGSIAGKIGISAAGRVIDFIGNDWKRRPALSGVLMTKENFVGCNGHLLRYVYNSGYNGPDVIIPAPAIRAALEFFGGYKGPEMLYTVNLSKDGRRLSFTASGIEINTRLIDAKYPDWKSVIPENNAGRITINKAELLSALKSVKGSYNKHTKAVKITVNESGGLSLIGENSDTETRAEIVLNSGYSSILEPGYKIGFNADYLNTVASNVASDLITFEINHEYSGRPVTIQNQSALIMPMLT
jgi:DNA polymerase III subunit beta